MTDELHTQSMDAFLDALASNAPTPGGGSVAAYSGAMAAGLISMVCALTLNRAQSDEEKSELQALHTQAEAIRLECQRLAQEDIQVFQRLSSAYKLPRTTDADAASRLAAIQKLTYEATAVPLRIAHAASRMLPLCTTLANRCTRLLASDIGIAATLARATIQSALLNVEINLASLDDKNYVRSVQSQLEDLTVGLAEEVQGVMEIVLSRIKA